MTFTKTFPVPEHSPDFGALYAAQKWCAEHGISYGSMQRGSPIGLKDGDYDIKKWRNLNKTHREMLDGTLMFNRGGDAVITITRKYLAQRLARDENTNA
jgi:hypothetical protein